jgi:hypothetical protein
MTFLVQFKRFRPGAGRPPNSARRSLRQRRRFGARKNLIGTRHRPVRNDSFWLGDGRSRMQRMPGPTNGWAATRSSGSKRRLTEPKTTSGARTSLMAGSFRSASFSMIWAPVGAVSHTWSLSARAVRRELPSRPVLAVQ